MRRHRTILVGLSCIFLLASASLVATYYIDVFPNEGGGVHEKTIELDEALAIAGLTTFSLFVFALWQYAISKREVKARIVAEQHARELAYQDGLTGLPNRRRYEEALNIAISAPPRAGASHAVFLLDLNGFKKINDVYGHGVGDDVLNLVGQRLKSATRDGDIVARFGGDEFAILATHLSDPESATTLALRVIESLVPPIRAAGVDHQIGVGIGIALLPGDSSSAEEALRKADIALYRTKQNDDPPCGSSNRPWTPESRNAHSWNMPCGAPCNAALSSPLSSPTSVCAIIVLLASRLCPGGTTPKWVMSLPNGSLK
jgi:diguanylate cyclase (GGDEF)-like protein